ncbi:MerR family transcriptional regulator [Sedimentibacter sp. MB31-C6]|uniref:MerR family transcriptional regulator n=1 Tax=Sedimentibacter sp. MB31-C6 TaxID=3109366 RepID=UPI002DDD16C6|nr:MerR family transcriptional regulator [Sedimentibacter sp. MB36-C1]WSI03198.1 MerR family transcriptional regulator [Sedimentibacter sp. MB36-C1]
MKYKSGDVQKILGVSVETLRYFDSIGLIKPERNQINNYKYYDTLDLNKIVAYKFYRGYEFTLDESLDILKIDNRSVLGKLNEKTEDIKEKCIYYENLLMRVEDLKKSFEYTNFVGELNFEDSPEVLLYYNQKNDEFQTDEVILDTTRKYLEYLPFVYLAVHISQFGDKVGQDIHFGYAVNTKYKHVINKLHNTLGKIYPSKKCIHTILKITDDALIAESLNYVIDYMKKEGLKLNGDIIGWIINEEVLTKGVIRYFEIWVPIK